MAKFYPKQIPERAPSSEKETWRAIASLDDQWRAFHGVAWQVPKATHQFDGEADFVLVHPRHGLIVLEVKGGSEIWVDEGTWYQGSRDGEANPMKDPFVQAKDAMYDLGTYLDRAVPGVGALRAGRAVVFPFATAPDDLGPQAPPAQTIGRDELRDLPAAVDRLIAHARLDTHLSSDQVEAITSYLAPTTQLQVRLSTQVADASERLAELTVQQIRLMWFLRRRRRSLVTGGAGTGKTVLAREQARRLAAEGLDVLLTCFNRPLADHLADELVGTSVHVRSFHQLVFDLGMEAGAALPSQPTKEWYQTEAPEVLADAATALNRRFDAVVVDEGQDFFPAWFTTLQLLLADLDHGPFHVFYDERQTIYVEGWEPPFPDDPFVLDINCRNTLPIARRINRVIGADAPDQGADGIAPTFLVAADAEAVVERIVGEVDRLTGEERIRPDQIAVLSDRRDPIDRLRALDPERFVPIGSKGVVAETIHRFKGLEADVVIVALHDISDDRRLALAYVGMSRARTVLIVVGSSGVKRGLGW